MSLPQDTHEFRLFYNQQLHPALVRLEYKRQRLIFFFALTVLILGLSGWAVYYLQLPALALLIWMPVMVYISFLGWQMRRFKASFKPRIVQMLLNYIQHPMRYDQKGVIDKKRFIRSRFFASPATYYKGEDFIEGQIGQLAFELCELDVRAPSSIGRALEPIFRGIFFCATTYSDDVGEIIILPKSERPYLHRTIKELIRRGHTQQKISESFDRKFVVYSDINANVHPQEVIHPDFYAILEAFSTRLGKRTYFSYVNGTIYLGVWEEKDILEPYIFRSNVSFKLVNEFYTDLSNIISLIENFDHLQQRIFETQEK